MPAKTNKTRAILMILFLAVWILLVLYPNPFNLTTSVYRLINPPVMPGSVVDIAAGLTDYTPCEIRVFVYTRIPYQYDWQVYGMPWYFPTLAEALQNGSGDCKSRFLLFASLMEELGIPYEKQVSFTHIWVSYEGKPENTLENEGEVLFAVNDDGSIRLGMPSPDFRRSLRSIYRGFWEAMPDEKKILLFASFPAVFGLSGLTQPPHGSRLLPATHSQLLLKQNHLRQLVLRLLQG